MLPLWVAEMDVMPARPIVEALRDALDRRDTGYACGSEYAESYATFAADRWGVGGFEVACSAVVPDVMLGAVELLKLVTGPGDAVVVTPPVYPPFYAFAEHLGRRVVEVPLTAQRRLDLPALADAFAAAAAGGRRHFCFAARTTRPARFTPSASWPRSRPRRTLPVCVSWPTRSAHPSCCPGRPSPLPRRTRWRPGLRPGLGVQGMNLPGLKAAVAVAGPDAADDLARLPEEVSHGPSHLGMRAHTAALRRGQEWLDALLSGLDRNRTLLGELLEAHLPSVRWTPGEATYLAWLDFAGLPDVVAADGEGGPVRGDASARVGAAAWLLEHARVLLSSGPAFGSGGERCARLNFATSATVLAQAWERMGEAAARAPLGTGAPVAPALTRAHPRRSGAAQSRNYDEPVVGTCG